MHKTPYLYANKDCGLIVLGLRSKCQEPINIPFSCVSDNAIEAVDEFAFLEGEFTVSTDLFPAGDVSSNLTETDACFSSVHGNSSPCFLFLGKKKKKKHFPFLRVREFWEIVSLKGEGEYKNTGGVSRI